MEALLQIYSCFFSQSIKIYVAAAISSVTVSLHDLPRCLCPVVTYRAPIQWFQINPGCTPKKTYAYDKNPESLCYEQKHMSVLIWIETIIEYWFNYSSSSKFSSAAQTLTFAEEPVQFASRFNAILDKQKANLDHSDGKCRDCECICVLRKTSYTLLFQILKFPSHKFVPHGFQLC